MEVLPAEQDDDHLIELRASLKWSDAGGRLACDVGEMDFGTAPAVQDAVREAVSRCELGYPSPGLLADCRDAFGQWASRRHGWDVSEELTRLAPGVLPGYWAVLNSCVPAAWPVVVIGPTYWPLTEIPRRLGRSVRTAHMRSEGGSWAIPHDEVARLMDDGPALVVLCNPGNPTGHVATQDELQDLMAVVETLGGLVFSDEIHAPFVAGQRIHVPYAHVGAAAARHSIVACSASKGWGLSGLSCAQLVFGTESLVDAWDRRDYRSAPQPSTLGIVATIAAYREGGAWLDRVCDRLAHNLAALSPVLGLLSPDTPPPGAGCFVWVDLRPWRRGEADTAAEVVARAGVTATEGSLFGSPGWARLNIATSQAVVADLAGRMRTIVDQAHGGAS